MTIIVKTGKNKVVGLFKLFEVFVDFMDSSFSNNKAKYLTLIQTAQMLSVSIDVLLQWNDFNILKPTITQRGQIVYSKEQIDRFLEAQQLLQINKVEDSELNRAQEHNYTGISIPALPRSSQNIFMSHFSAITQTKSFPITLAVTLSIIVVTLLSLAPIKSDKSKIVTQNTKAPSQKEDVSTKVLSPQTNSSFSSESTPLSIKVKDGGSSYTNLAANRFSQGQVLGSQMDKNSALESPKLDTNGYNEIAQFSGSANNLFDDSGNIKGDTPNGDVLGIAGGISKIIHVDNASLPASNSDYIFLLIIAIAVSTIIVIKRLPAYSFRANDGTLGHRGSSDINSHKVFEVDQKTDGTVVLYFQGNEYKLSKPELDSESDQFIERLMEISDTDQEIDYDKSSDENIKLSTPLSKLVTRLGFVGTKRDLFFPRTSKNKVLFRRYITEEDLTAMNLNATELFKAFTTNTSS